MSGPFLPAQVWLPRSGCPNVLPSPGRALAVLIAQCLEGPHG
ncbi:hypothetical protein Mal64_38030 [Pseudobythopirellula maris]|uniref:Uncharacterized protein n=1 Tax=Pseudobythopirellula maris TaxID=2527991 RepID=A0A5C5ZI95_9BACT|nr:hypothetical protein Mal64_38030 [Pseudobythopirellula maris]